MTSLRPNPGMMLRIRGIIPKCPHFSYFQASEWSNSARFHGRFIEIMGFLWVFYRFYVVIFFYFHRIFMVIWTSSSPTLSSIQSSTRSCGAGPWARASYSMGGWIGPGKGGLGWAVMTRLGFHQKNHKRWGFSMGNPRAYELFMSYFHDYELFMMI